MYVCVYVCTTCFAVHTLPFRSIFGSKCSSLARSAPAGGCPSAALAARRQRLSDRQSGPGWPWRRSSASPPPQRRQRSPLRTQSGPRTPRCLGGSRLGPRLEAETHRRWSLPNLTGPIGGPRDPKSARRQRTKGIPLDRRLPTGTQGSGVFLPRVGCTPAWVLLLRLWRHSLGPWSLGNWDPRHQCICSVSRLRAPAR